MPKARYFRDLLRAASFLAMLWGACAAQAELVSDVYSALIAVGDRQADSLSEARREGLLQVAAKASGMQVPADNEVIKGALATVSSYLQGFSYVDGAEGALSVRLDFDEAAIQQLLGDAGLPLWTANRPSVLTWLVMNDGSRRRFASLDEMPQAYAAISGSFERRGVPLQQPLYDLADATALTPGEAWRQSSTALTIASQRYGDPGVLAGRVARLSNGRYAGDWQFLDEGVWHRVTVQVEDLEAFTDAGADLVASRLSARYAVAAAAIDLRHRVVLRGVRSYGDYRSALMALETLETVRQVMPEQLVGDQVTLRVDADADSDQLSRIIELDERFVPARLTSGFADLSYEWIQ
ncbi:MAG: DUF2066 domain-containing protein [Pseudomonadota bacterium]